MEYKWDKGEWRVTANQKAPPLAGELSVSDSEQTEGEQLGKLSSFEPFPFLT